MTLKSAFSQHYSLSDECIAEIETLATLKTFGRKKCLVHQGELCHNFYINKSGLLRIVHEKDGLEDTIGFGTAGDTFTSMHSLYAAKQSIFSLVTIEPSEVWIISHDEMERLSLKYPELVWWLRNLLIEQVYSFERRYIFFGMKDATMRYRNFISNRKSTFLRVPIKYIAQYLKIAPETLSRIRRRMISN